MKNRAIEFMEANKNSVVCVAWNGNSVGLFLCAPGVQTSKLMSNQVWMYGSGYILCESLRDLMTAMDFVGIGGEFNLGQRDVAVHAVNE